MKKKWLMVLLIFAGIMYCCSTETDDKSYKKSITDFIDYVHRSHTIDTAFFSQNFLSDTIRDKKYKYNLMLLGLNELKPKIDAAERIQIDKVDVNVVGMPSEYRDRIYTAVFIRPSGRDSLFFIMERNGIESFTVIRKGDRIISW